MYARTSPGSIPESMYEGGFADSGGAVRLALEHFGIAPPATLYYPGSSSDVNLIGIEGLHVIHADDALNEQMLGGFALLGAEAHRVDVHEWRPEQPIDAVAFINPTGIDETRVVERTDLRESGLVLWAAWSGRPEALKALTTLSLVGVMNYVEDDGYTMDTGDLDTYFTGDKVGTFYVFQKNM